MGILRTDVLSHSQLSNGNASVLFDGTADRLTIPSHSAFAFGTADWTVEGWFYFTSITGQQTLVGDTYGNTAGWYLYKQNNHRLGVYYSSLLVDGTATIETDRWYHFAFVRNSGRTRIYINGELDAEGADTTDATTTQYYIGDTATSSGEFFGNISNLRITRTAVYKDNFTVPKFKLKEIPGTILLCCQSSSSTTEATVSVPGTLTTGGDPTATAFGPGLKEDITDTGVVFDGVTTFDSQAYFVPPSGKTTERNRGRGVYMLGYSGTPAAGNNDRIDYINIQSQGNSIRFGSLTANRYTLGAGANSTRCLFTGGYVEGNSPDTDVNIIEFVTIASEGNATDFGDRTQVGRLPACASNDTRCVMASAKTGAGNQDTIDFVTIATTGNATGFGDLTSARTSMCMSCNSTTRGIFSGGYQPSPVNGAINTIEFITFATTGNGTNFGDLTSAAQSSSGGTASSSTRGLIGLGFVSPARVNTIDFVTIASTGDASDFGDLTLVRQAYGSVSNSTRGVFLGGSDPYTNTIDFVLIASTGDATEFGDVSVTQSGNGAAGSDSHGGLS